MTIKYRCRSKNNPKTPGLWFTRCARRVWVAALQSAVYSFADKILKMVNNQIKYSIVEYNIIYLYSKYISSSISSSSSRSSGINSKI